VFFVEVFSLVIYSVVGLWCFFGASVFFLFNFVRCPCNVFDVIVSP